jgi:hypothetical protein
MVIHGRSIRRIRINFDSHSGKTKLQNEEIAFGTVFVRMLIFLDLDDEREWPRRLASGRGC